MVLAGGQVGISAPAAITALKEVVGASATASISLYSDGTMAVVDGVGTSWFSLPYAGVGNNYWVRYTLTSGTAPSGVTMGTWTSLAATVTASLTQLAVGSKSAVLTIAFATDSAGTNIVFTGTASIQAIRS